MRTNENIHRHKRSCEIPYLRFFAPKKQQIGDADTLQGTQTEGGDLAEAVSEEAKEEEDNMYTFHLFQFKEVCYAEKGFM